MSVPPANDSESPLRFTLDRFHRLQNKKDPAQYEAEWRRFLLECRKEVEKRCRWNQIPEEEIEIIQRLAAEKLPEAVEKYDPAHASSARFQTYLGRVITNVIRDYHREQKTERFEVNVYSAGESGAEGSGGGGASDVRRPSNEESLETANESTPATELEHLEAQADRKTRIERHLANSRIDERRKQLFRRLAFDGQSVQDVAREFRITTSEVAQVKAGVIQGLRHAERRSGSPPDGIARPEAESPVLGQEYPGVASPSNGVVIGRRVRSLTLSMASPEQIRSWSSGEVTRAATLNSRSLEPVPDGLLCERIFGPLTAWKCVCGKKCRFPKPGQRCAACGLELPSASARRHRMGHIELAAPVLNGWLFKVHAPLVCLVLELSRSEVDELVHRSRFLVLDPRRTPLRRHEILDDIQHADALRDHGPKSFESACGTTALLTALTRADLPKRLAQLEASVAELKNTQDRLRRTGLLRQLEALIQSGTRLEWMVMTVLPVMPAGLRPENALPSQTGRELEDGKIVTVVHPRVATSDLNRLYRKILSANNRLKYLMGRHSPAVILSQATVTLQKAVDGLLYVGRPSTPSSRHRELKPLVRVLEGKSGRFRGNLLGKRVDYSGRAVIVVEPELKLHQCGLPFKQAVVLFEPFLVHRLWSEGLVGSVRQAREIIRRKPAWLRSHVEEVIRGRVVLLNRAPTLHRLSVQAFEPVLVSGDAIRLHPLVCAAFGADFDGDQMAVHVPLTEQAQREARDRMMARSNLLSPGNGRPILAPSQDIALGCFYLTLEPREEPAPSSPSMLLGSKHEALFALEAGHLKLHDRIRIPNPDHGYQRPYGVSDRRVITTTAGRVVFNDALPEDLGFVNEALNKEGLTQLVATCRHRLGVDPTLDALDRIKEVGFRAATRAGISVGVDDLIVPTEKTRLVEAAREAESLRRRRATARHSCNTCPGCGPASRTWPAWATCCRWRWRSRT